MSTSATRISYHNGYIPGQYINGAQHANGAQYANEEYANGGYGNGQFANRRGGYRQALTASLTTHHVLSLSAPIGRRRFDTFTLPPTTLHPSTPSLCCWQELPRSFRNGGLRPEPTDEECAPTGHMKTPNPKRGPKAARSSDSAGDDSFDNNYTATSSRSKPTKRRKMSAPPVHLQALKSTALRESTNPSLQNIVDVGKQEEKQHRQPGLQV